MEQKTKNNTYDLLQRVKEGDFSAKEELINENIKLVYAISKKFINRGIEFEDLVQIGSIGLINAIEKFDISFDVMFSTYAVPLIVGEIKRYLRDNGPIKVSRNYRILNMKAAAMREKLIENNGKEPTINEIAKSLNVEARNWRRLLKQHRFLNQFINLQVTQTTSC